MEWCNYVSSQLSCPAHESMLVCFIEIQLNSTVSPHIILCFTVRWALERSPAILFVRILKISSIVESLSNVFSPLHLNYPFNKKTENLPHENDTRSHANSSIASHVHKPSIHIFRTKKKEKFSNTFRIWQCSRERRRIFTEKIKCHQ